MRILIITQWFDPEQAFKGLIFAKHLRSAGNEVEVITGFPNYPGGTVYSGYKIRWFQRELMDGIRVNRVPLYPSHNSSVTQRVCNYLSFAISSFIYGIFAAGRSDIIYAYHPPLTVSLSAAFISLVRRVPFVVDINDLWPDTLAATGMVSSKRVLFFVEIICQWLYRRASHLVVGTPGLLKRLIARGVPAEKIDIIYNWCDEQTLHLNEGKNADYSGMTGRFNVVFAGTMGKAQALNAVIHAAKRVQTLAPSVQFVFVGGGIEVENLKALKDRLNADNVVFLPLMPVNEIGKVLNIADVLLVHLKDHPLFEITLPSKTQAYMSVGKPILMAVKGDAANLINASGGGCCAIPENEASIAETVVKMANLPSKTLVKMGSRNKSFYIENLSLAVGTEKFLSIFKLVLLSPNR
jgi:colanic acid biosynthesis glycosyl transferase WcaI